MRTVALGQDVLPECGTWRAPTLRPEAAESQRLQRAFRPPSEAGRETLRERRPPWLGAAERPHLCRQSDAGGIRVPGPAVLLGHYA